jgi:hypothetical protein
MKSENSLLLTWKSILHVLLANVLCRLIRNCKASNDTAKIRLIIEQLCQEFAFGPSRQNASALGGLIGLAAVAIALSHVLDSSLAANHVRTSPTTWTTLYHQCSDVSRIRTLDYGTMPWNRCTTLPRSQREKYYSTSMKYSTRCARYRLEPLC